MKKIILGSVLGLAALGLSASAMAVPTYTTQLDTPLTVYVNSTTHGCQITSDDLYMNGYDHTLGVNANGSAEFHVNCQTGSSGVDVDADNGIHTGSSLTRLAINGAEAVAYNLYKDSAFSQVFGNSMAGGTKYATPAPGGATTNYTFWGKTDYNNGASTVLTGTATDSVNLTLTYN